MPTWLWALAFIAVLMAIAWLADKRVKHRCRGLVGVGSTGLFPIRDPVAEIGQRRRAPAHGSPQRWWNSFGGRPQ